LIARRWQHFTRHGDLIIRAVACQYPQGPHVGLNWQTDAARFAPSRRTL